MDVARIERKRELNPSCAKHTHIYSIVSIVSIQEGKLWRSMKAICAVQQSPFDLACCLLSLTDRQADEGRAPHSNRLTLRYHPLRSQL
jgi:hypothetical protein